MCFHLQTQLPALTFTENVSQPKYTCLRHEESAYEKGMKWAYSGVNAIINSVSLPFPHRDIFTDNALSFMTGESVRNSLEEKYERVRWLFASEE